MRGPPSCGGHAHTLKFSPGKGGSRTPGFASLARVLKAKSPLLHGVWVYGCPPCPRGCWSSGFSWGTKVLAPPFGVWRLRTRWGSPGSEVLILVGGGRTPEAAVGGADSGPGAAPESLAGKPLPQQKAEEAVAGAGPRGRRLGGRGSADTAPACRRGPRGSQVCEAAAGAENRAPQPARPAEPGLPRGLWGHPSAPPGRPHAAPGACPAAR